MIRNFSDHAANERTFLAWVRTAVALMAFGFVVERFNLFLLAERAALGAKAVPPAGAHLGAFAGLGLMVFGLAMTAVATVRFIRTSRAIDDVSAHPGPGSRLDIALAVMLVLLGGALVVYLISNLAGPH
jgi:putative membrane protein